MSLDPVSAVANAVGGVAAAAKPIIDEILAQQYEREFDERIQEWQKIVFLPAGDPAADAQRADRMADFILRLCASSGTPIGGLGENVSVPVSALNALVLGTCNSIKNEQLLNFLTRHGQ